MKNILAMLFFFTVISCNEIKFVYNEKENLSNPLYEKTNVDISGVDLGYLYSYIPVVFGTNKTDEFNLEVKVYEKKTKSSIKTNQAVSNLKYELRFLYTLRSNDLNCITYKKEVVSIFDVMPKSSGYNFGTDASLERNYELAITDNLNRFLSFISESNLNSCNED